MLVRQGLATSPRRTALVLGVVALAVLAALLWPKAGSAFGDQSITSPDTEGAVGTNSSLLLDASGYPVVSYYDTTNGDLKVLHCNDAGCSGGDESIVSPETGGNVGQYTSLALDGSGYPVVSHYDATNANLGVLHCNDADCSGGDESSAYPDVSGVVGRYTSLELDNAGNPVVSYHDDTNGDLKVLHCNDANCSGGDESISSPDTGGVVGRYTSLALDSDGNPVVSYYDDTNGDLKLLHCNDPDCLGGDESITSPDTGGTVGEYTSLVLDGSGYPAVSYYDGTNVDLKLLHCNDPNCAGGDENITSPDTDGYVGFYTSLALDAHGNPVVSYSDLSDYDLKVLHCNDSNCSGGGDSTTSPDTGGSVGQHTSLALDDSGHPVVSYYDASSADLKVLHCGDADCAGHKTPPFDTPTPDVECADVTGDGWVTSRDLAAVARQMRSEEGDRRYDPWYDLNRDGRIDVADLWIVLLQLGDTCERET